MEHDHVQDTERSPHVYFPSSSRYSHEAAAVTLALQMRKLKPKVPQLEFTIASGYTVGINVLIENIYQAPTVCQALSWVLGKQ